MPAISNDSDFKDKTTTQDKNANKVLPSSLGERRVKIHDPISDQKMLNLNHGPGHVCRRGRQLSSSKSEDHLMTTDLGMVRSFIFL